MVVLIAAAVIVISVTVCLRKRTQHVNITDNVAYGTSRNEIELSACDDVANQPSSGQL